MYAAIPTPRRLSLSAGHNLFQTTNFVLHAGSAVGIWLGVRLQLLASGITAAVALLATATRLELLPSQASGGGFGGSSAESDGLLGWALGFGSGAGGEGGGGSSSSGRSHAAAASLAGLSLAYALPVLGGCRMSVGPWSLVLVLAAWSECPSRGACRFCFTRGLLAAWLPHVQAASTA